MTGNPSDEYAEMGKGTYECDGSKEPQQKVSKESDSCPF